MIGNSKAAASSGPMTMATSGVATIPTLEKPPFDRPRQITAGMATRQNRRPGVPHLLDFERSGRAGATRFAAWRYALPKFENRTADQFDRNDKHQHIGDTKEHLGRDAA